jgi:hypothetical protein
VSATMIRAATASSGREVLLLFTEGISPGHSGTREARARNP